MHHATVQYNSTVHVTAVSIIHLCHTAVLYNYKSELYYTTLQLHNKSALLAVSWVTARITHLYCSVGVAIIQIGVAIAQRHNRIALYHTNTSCSFTIPLYHTFTLYEIQLNCTTQLNNCTVLELQLHHNHTLLYHTCNCASCNCTRETHTVIITVLYHELQLYILCSDTSTIQQQCIVSCNCAMQLHNGTVLNCLSCSSVIHPNLYHATAYSLECTSHTTASYYTQVWTAPYKHTSSNCTTIPYIQLQTELL